MEIWPEDWIDREKRRLRVTGVAGACLYLAPVVVVALLRGESPWSMPGFHVAIPIVLLCLLPLAYIMMPLFDGVLAVGKSRPTTPRAALIACCVTTNGIGLASLYLFFHSGGLLWPVILWLLGLPAALGIIRRIGAYQGAMQRTASSAE